MSLQLHAINLFLRLAVKPTLARLREPAAARARFERDAARYFCPPAGAFFHEDTIRRPDDLPPMPVLWASRGRPDRHRIVLYFHGGAYLAGSPRTHRHLAAAIAGAAGVRVLVPDYRLAPENPYPAALEDGLAAYRHLLDRGYAPDRIAIAGDSSGGGLTFALALRIADDGLPRPAALVGISPWADLRGVAESLKRNAARDVMLPARRLREVADYYLAGADPAEPTASPVLGAWRDPPPVLIMASRSEILADDARALAEGLRAGGGNVRLEIWPRMPHAWPLFTGLMPEAGRAVRNIGGFLRAHGSGGAPPDRNP